MNKLKQIREKQGVSQTNLAAEVGVSARHISFIENDDRNPSIDIALKIAAALNVSVEEIFLPDRCTKST